MSPRARELAAKEVRICPSCRSKNTIRTHEQLGEQLFFCADCEHTWSIRKGKTPAKSRA
jgi:transposase-like protein